MSDYMEKKIKTEYVVINNSVYADIKVSIYIKDKGIRERCSLNLMPACLEDITDRLTEECLREFDNTSEKVVSINRSGINPSQMQQSQQQNETLSPEELNTWSDKAMRIMGNEIDRLKKNKKLLNIENNQQLEKYIQQFSNGQISRAQEIVPGNIANFNNYLEELLNNNQQVS